MPARGAREAMLSLRALNRATLARFVEPDARTWSVDFAKAKG